MQPTIRPAVAEDAVTRTQHATGNYAQLTPQQHRDIAQAIAEYHRGTLTRHGLAVRLEHIAGVDR